MLKKIREAIKKRFNNQAGFTLVELMVVIVILGILAAIVIPKFSGSNAKAKAAADSANKATIQSAAERYYIEHNDTYPTDLDDLVNNGYLKSLPSKPTGGSYSISTDGTVN